MIVEIPCLPVSLDPKERESTRYRVCFQASAVVLIREVLNLASKRGVVTKIVFRGDTYEHHAIETDLPYDEVKKLVGWSEESK